MKHPLVSVVMPFRNSEPYIGQALDSLLRQTFEDYEVLMIDHLSRDGSRQIAASRAARDQRLRLIDGRGSFVEVLNLGLKAAAGKWIARFDSDDVCHPLRLELQLAAASSLGERHVITSRVRSFPDEAVSTGYRRYENWVNSTTAPKEIEKALFIESPVPHPTAFFHRDSVLAAGGYSDRRLPEDYELWLRLWSLGFSFQRVPRVLLGWRERGDRLSRTSSRYSLTAFYRTKAMYLEHVPCLADKEVFVAGTGQCARRLSTELIRRDFTVRGFLSPKAAGEGRLLKGIPVVEAADWRSDCGIPVLVASRQPGARENIRGYLDSLGLSNWRDYVLCS